MTEQQELFIFRRISEMEMRIEQMESTIDALTKSTNLKSDYYTIEEYADIMKVCKATVYHKVKHGYIIGVKIGKNWRIPKSELIKNSL